MVDRLHIETPAWPDPDGELVRFADYEKLHAELEQVKRERDEARKDAQFFRQQFDDQVESREAAERLAGAGVVVKPLEWSSHPTGGEQALAAGLGLYRVHANGDDWYLGPDHMGKGGKAAAQSDYESRILSALAEPAGEAEPSKWSIPGSTYAGAATPPASAIREALEPFRRLADEVFRIEDGREMNSGKSDDSNIWGFDRATITYGDLRRLRAALAGSAE